MEFDKKHGYLIQWLIGIGDLLVLNLLFFAVYNGLDILYTKALSYSLREVVLLLNFCYFFSLYFVPMQLHVAVVFIDKIVQRAFALVSILVFLFATCLIFLNIGDALATFLIVYYLITIVIFALWRVLVRVTLKMYRRKGHNFKKIIIVGAGKNGMELYRVMKDDLSYGFHVMGFFDDNLSLQSVLPNYLGMTHEVEDYVLANDIDEIYCTLPGTQDEKILRIINFAEKHMIYAGLNMDLEDQKSQRYSFSVEGFPSGALDFLAVAMQYKENGKPGGSESKSRRVGFVGNASYSFEDRYFVDASFRTDGSSLYGADKRFAPFWSAGIG